MVEAKTPVVGKTTNVEFGGIPGAYLMVFGLPVGVFAITLMCNKESCDLGIPSLSSVDSWWDNTAVIIFLCWFLFHVVIQLLPIGQLVEGQVLRTGERLKYRCNAFHALELSLALFVALVSFGVRVRTVYDLFIPLAVVATVFSFALALMLYVKSLSAPNHALAEGGNTGNFMYDFFLGRELNPRIGELDLKFFCELRPGLIGWVMLDLAFMAQAHHQYGSIPPALILISLFHFWYVADALWFEEAILTTMDIVHDGFGLMLVFGDLVWVPFLYSLQARYALEHPVEWSPLALAAFVLMQVIGYLIFRGSNSQKNEFRKNPHNPALMHLETLPTARGTKLLISGWWGLCRHPNYLGDLIMATAWSLPCGFNNILPYFYPIYFLALLVHRSLRDEASCRKKYGKDWDVYCSKVKYRIFPYIY